MKPIEKYTNTKLYKEYADECINQIFPFEVYFKINTTRLESEEDKLKLEQFKEDIFDETIDVITTIKKYFPFTQDITKSLKKCSQK